MPSKDNHRSWPREDYGRAHRASERFVHVNVHAYSHPHLNKSGQPFRHPVPWLVHYAEAILTCKNSQCSEASLPLFHQTVPVRQTYSHSLPSRVSLYTCWIIKPANLGNHESFKIRRPPFCIFLWKQHLHFIQNERKQQEGTEEMRKELERQNWDVLTVCNCFL